MKIDNIFPISIDTDITFLLSEKPILLFPILYNELNEAKSKIDNCSNSWDKTKKIVNPYELIHVSYCRDKVNNSIAYYKPLSRSFFKMWEMIYDYRLLENIKKPIVTASLAEGPGGFMEAIDKYRSNIDDKYYGITLPPTDKYIPGWSKIRNKDCGNYLIKYGDLYKLDDVIEFTENFKNKKAYLVTADGGFDYSSDFNNQEQMSYRIIFSEIVTTLGIQEIGGCFVCKIFDTFSIFTIKILYLLYCVYDEVNITKPRTSRSANSEKYVVAKGYKGIDDKILDILYKMIKNWEDEVSDKYISDIKGFQIDNHFIHMMHNYNKNYIENQLKYINKTIKYAQNRPDKDKYRKIIKKQVNNAILWCKRYYVPINKNSRFMNYLR